MYSYLGIPDWIYTLGIKEGLVEIPTLFPKK